MVQFLLGVSVDRTFRVLSRASSSVEVAQIRAKLDAIPLDQKVDLTNKEWLVMIVAAAVLRHAPSGHQLRPLAVTRSVTATAFTFALRAAIRFTVWRRNSIRTPVGQVFGSRSGKKLHQSSTSSAIFGVEIPVRPGADRISDMSSMTDLRQLDCATRMNAVALTYREASPGSAPALPRADQNRP